MQKYTLLFPLLALVACAIALSGVEERFATIALVLCVFFFALFFACLFQPRRL